MANAEEAVSTKVVENPEKSTVTSCIIVHYDAVIARDSPPRSAPLAREHPRVRYVTVVYPCNPTFRAVGLRHGVRD